MAKTIIVTGANGNLGKATVKKLLEEGWQVIATGTAGSASFETIGKNPDYKTVDLSNEQQSAAFVEEAIRQYGAIEGALLLVGGFAMGEIKATGREELAKMYQLNFETAYHVARPVFLHMLEKGYGRIALVGARPALIPAQGKNMVAYALSKSLLFTLASLLNEAAAGKNVITSVIVPGIFDTVQNRESMPEADPANWVKAEQIAEILAFICGDTASALRDPVYKIYGNS